MGKDLLKLQYAQKVNNYNYTKECREIYKKRSKGK